MGSFVYRGRFKGLFLHIIHLAKEKCVIVNKSIKTVSIWKQNIAKLNSTYKVGVYTWLQYIYNVNRGRCMASTAEHGRWKVNEANY